MRGITPFILPALLLGVLSPVPPARAEGRIAFSGTGTLTSVLLYQGAIAAFEEKTAIQLVVVDPDIPLGKGLEKLFAGEVQVVGTGEPLTPEQTASGVVPHLLGHDALAVWVNAANPVTGLSRAELRALLTGETPSWAEQGGLPTPVRTFLPPFGAGFDTSDLVSEMILAGRPPGGGMDTSATAPWEQIARVSIEEGGLCLASPSLLHTLAPDIAARVKMIPLEGAIPSPEVVARGGYLLIHPLFLVTLGPPQGTLRQLVEFMTGTEGQAIVARDFLPAHPPASGRLTAPGLNREKTAPVRKPNRPARGRRP